MENEFGGTWTEKKIDILVKYAYAYLQIMKKTNFKLIYFDGFAGSGDIKIGSDEDFKLIEGAAKKIVSINDPISFDIYYFVEKDKDKRYVLEYALDQIRETNNVHVVADDCNNKLIGLAAFLRKNSNYRALVFLDPFGMNVEWSSIEGLKDLGVDLWILSPTGVGANRLLMKNSNQPEAWWKKLENFFGVSRDIIVQNFYQEKEEHNLFGIQKTTLKVPGATKKIFDLYCKKMQTIFKLTSNPYIIVNKNNSLMYHFFLASNNAIAVKIANEIVKKAT